ncbi:methyltransferase domain-containing protein [Apiospora hydei]|uniref:Methyltransferase domain-containing protein n=1 Tax=Apiospora hydei TaxID=1337664 RepID=A0ABR1WYN6_9PEZI
MAAQEAQSKPQAVAGTTEPAGHHPGDEHEIPSYESYGTFDSLKDRIKLHYNVASDYYYSLWGQHIHHGYWKQPNETKEEAQVNLINLLLEISVLPKSSRVLDVGCGIGGTSRFLAKEHDCQVTGVTISGRQVEIAQRLTLAEVDAAIAAAGDKTAASSTPAAAADARGMIKYPSGNSSVRFIELDAEKMLEYFKQQQQQQEASSFNCVWISEALSHFPNKPLFFSSAFELLGSGGGGNKSRLVIADWFKAKDLTPEQEQADIKPIEDGMLLPPLCTADQYVEMATKAGFKVLKGPMDISNDVLRTWDISWSLVSSPSLWAFAISQGRDGLAFLQSFRAMRRGYANGTFRYCCIAFEKP